MENRKEAVLFVSVALISSLSFSLGYLAALETEKAPIIIEKNS